MHLNDDICVHLVGLQQAHLNDDVWVYFMGLQEIHLHLCVFRGFEANTPKIVCM